MVANHVHPSRRVGHTPGPWSVVGHPWDRSRTTVVGANEGRGIEGDPHVSPHVLSTDPYACDACEAGDHPEGRHRADAQLANAAPRLRDLLTTIVTDADDCALCDGDVHAQGHAEDCARVAARLLLDSLPPPAPLERDIDARVVQVIRRTRGLRQWGDVGTIARELDEHPDEVRASLNRLIDHEQATTNADGFLEPGPRATSEHDEEDDEARDLDEDQEIAVRPGQEPP